MTQKNKDNAILDFQTMINQSWTWERLTREEKERWFDELRNIQDRDIKAIKGTYKDRWSILNSLYGMFLVGVGYNGFDWREVK